MAEGAKPPGVFDAGMFPSWHRPFWQWLGDHNPFLLLSTVCMLLGCYLVNGALHDEPSNTRMLILLGLINLYEACIIPLGMILIRRKAGTARDGWWLLLFEVLFLVNVTFVNPDFSYAWSVPLNVALWLLACGKVALLFWGLKIGLTLRTFGFMALQLGVIYGLPIVFALTNVDGIVSPKVMFALWWLVGLLPMAYDVVTRAQGKSPEWDLVQNVVRRVYLMAPWVMLLIHLRFSHWAHHSDFYLADAAPALLGIAVASLRLRLDFAWRFAMRLLPAAALFLAMTAPIELRWRLHIADEMLTLTPGLILVAGTILTYGYMASMFQFFCAAVALSVIVCGYVFQDMLLKVVSAMVRFIEWLLPTTTYAWGMLTILVAFVLLGVGSAISLRRQRRPA